MTPEPKQKAARLRKKLQATAADLQAETVRLGEDLESTQRQYPLRGFDLKLDALNKDMNQRLERDQQEHDLLELRLHALESAVEEIKARLDDLHDTVYRERRPQP
jgi:ATP phosphoribosyltransferase regulatory subunit HisZ